MGDTLTVEQSDSQTANVVLSVDAVAKNFGPTAALVDCSLDLREGEVHALLGENGSGKSTLAKLITGVYQPTSGRISLADEMPVTLRSPAAARALGVVAVYQDILVARRLSILDNIWLGTDRLFRRTSSKRHKHSIAAETLTRLLGREIDLTRPVSDLPLSDQQAVCIARALVQEFDILVLDEATSSLDLETRNRLFEIVKSLTAAGNAVLFVSHRMDEINQIADRLTVLRSGDTVATMPAGAATEVELLSLLTGRDHVLKVRGTDPRPRGQLSLKARGLRLSPGADEIDVDIYVNQIVAIAGLEGQGQDEFLKSLWGSQVSGGHVAVVDGDTERKITSPHVARKLGIAYVPRDRRDESTFRELTIRQNFELPTLAMDTQFGLIRESRTSTRFAHFADVLNLRYGRATDPMSSLSGGNQQKVVLARWLAMSPRIMLLNDPTRGVDVGTKREIYTILEGLRDQKVTVVLLSTEIDEILEVADRVLVFRNQHLASDLKDAEISREAILADYFGIGARS